MIEAEIVEDFKAPILSDIKYPVSEEYLNELVLEYKDIKEIDLGSETVGEEYQIVLKAHRLVAKQRNNIEKTRKAIKTPAFEFGKNVDAYAKKLQAIIKETEDKLKLQRDRVEQNEARIQREAEAAEENRISNIKRLLNQLKNSPMECIGKSSKVIKNVLKMIIYPTIEEFEEFHDEAIIIYKNSTTQIQQMIEHQVLVENAEAVNAEAVNAQNVKREEEEEKFKRDREEFEREKEELAESKKQFQQHQDYVKEEENRKLADKEAHDLMLHQEEEKARKIKKEKEEKEKQAVSLKNRTEICYIESHEDLRVLKIDTYILDLIIENKIRNVRFEVRNG